MTNEEKEMVREADQAGMGSSLKMSEAQYYAIKDVAHAFGYDISYDKVAGFAIT